MVLPSPLLANGSCGSDLLNREDFACFATVLPRILHSRPKEYESSRLLVSYPKPLFEASPWGCQLRTQNRVVCFDRYLHEKVTKLRTEIMVGKKTHEGFDPGYVREETPPADGRKAREDGREGSQIVSV